MVVHYHKTGKHAVLAMWCEASEVELVVGDIEADLRLVCVVEDELGASEDIAHDDSLGYIGAQRYLQSCLLEVVALRREITAHDKSIHGNKHSQ